MFVPFSTLPDESRVWVFQANRRLTREESALAAERLRTFTDEWSVHGSPLRTSFRIEFDQFIILAADESAQNASGCSIDSSVRVLKSVEQALGIQLFERNLVAFKKAEEVMMLPVKELKQNFMDGILTEDTLTFNNLVPTKSAFEKEWITPAGATWLKRYMRDPLAKVD
jgi:hypothetical protein